MEPKSASLVDMIAVNAVCSTDSPNLSPAKSKQRKPPTTKKTTFCEVCQENYATRKSFLKHQKTKKHAANLEKHQEN